MISYPKPSRLLALIRITTILAGILACSQVASAQSDVLHAFPGPGAVRPHGPLLLAADGNFYGSTSAGGTADLGTVFKMTPGGAVTILHEFAGSGRGALPYGALIQATDGNFYGTTTQGGSSNGGTVFKMTLTGSVTILHSFTGADGFYPYGGLVQASDGDVYGTTAYGGAPGLGTVFKITLGGTLTLMHAFTGGVLDGKRPYAGVIQATDGNYYGTTYEGGTADLGTVFKMTPAGAVTVLHAFTNAVSDGKYPYYAPLVQAADGDLYGTTYLGGAGGLGTVFKTTLAGTFTLLHGFTNLDGAYPYAGLLQAPGGNFYGTTTFGGGVAGSGVVFQMTPAGVVTVVHAFNNADGAFPYAAVVKAADGSFYGTTYSGGAFTVGTVFQVTSGGTYTLRHSFTGGPEGARPKSSLIQATDGHLYGTTSIGGTADLGAVFKITTGGTVTLLHSFTNIGDGANPEHALVQANDGNFYGSVPVGNRIFKVTPAGTFTTQHSLDFTTEGYGPSALIQAADGDLYGTTQYGGVSSVGSAFKMTLAGVFTVLHMFTGVADGAGPRAGLVQATDGNFYGTANNGGASNMGTVFKMTPAGTVTVLHAFTGGADGSFPQAALIQAADGNLYGTTYNGGASNRGTVFKTNLTGSAFTILHSFNLADGQYPYSPVLQAPDGNFYGTTYSVGAPPGAGTIFKMTPMGNVTTEHTFNTTNGANPFAGLTRTPGGHFYGTTFNGGPSANVGVVFHLHLNVAAPFTDDPLTANSTTIKAAHITELRTRIDVVRAAHGLGGFAWGPAISAGTTIQAQHILDLREALRQAYLATPGFTPPTYTDPAPAAGTSVTAVHISEIRSALVAIE